MNHAKLSFGLTLAFILAGQTLHPAVVEFDPTQPYTIVDPAARARLDDLRAKAKKGDAKSQCELAHAFRFGWFGVGKNEVEAVEWYRKAAEQNNAEAQSDLGECYAWGRGVAKDEVEEGAKPPIKITPRLNTNWASATPRQRA
jgi:hypothetical protein